MSTSTGPAPISLAQTFALSSAEIGGASPARCMSAIASALAAATSKPLALKPTSTEVGTRSRYIAGTRPGGSVRPLDGEMLFERARRARHAAEPDLRRVHGDGALRNLQRRFLQPESLVEPRAGSPATLVSRVFSAASLAAISGREGCATRNAQRSSAARDFKPSSVTSMFALSACAAILIGFASGPALAPPGVTENAAARSAMLSCTSEETEPSAAAFAEAVTCSAPASTVSSTPVRVRLEIDLVGAA